MEYSYTAAKVGTTPRILIVEDNDDSRAALGDYLNSLGYQVLELADGTTFFSVLDNFQPHLVLLDLKMPNMDGYAVLEQFHQKTNWSEVPVIVVSAFAFRADRQRAINLGARRFLVKPITPNQLKQVIDEELRSLTP